MANHKVCKICNHMKAPKEFRKANKSAKRIQTCMSCESREDKYTHRHCNDCDRTLEITAFAKCGSNADGSPKRKYKCKECCRVAPIKKAGLTGINAPFVAKPTAHDTGAKRHWLLLHSFCLTRVMR